MQVQPSYSGTTYVYEHIINTCVYCSNVHTWLSEAISGQVHGPSVDRRGFLTVRVWLHQLVITRAARREIGWNGKKLPKSKQRGGGQLASAGCISLNLHWAVTRRGTVHEWWTCPRLFSQFVVKRAQCRHNALLWLAVCRQSPLDLGWSALQRAQLRCSFNNSDPRLVRLAGFVQGSHSALLLRSKFRSPKKLIRMHCPMPRNGHWRSGAAWKDFEPESRRSAGRPYRCWTRVYVALTFSWQQLADFWPFSAMCLDGSRLFWRTMPEEVTLQCVMF